MLSGVPPPEGKAVATVSAATAVESELQKTRSGAIKPKPIAQAWWRLPAGARLRWKNIPTAIDLNICISFLSLLCVLNPFNSLPCEGIFPSTSKFVSVQAPHRGVNVRHSPLGFTEGGSLATAGRQNLK